MKKPVAIVLSGCGVYDGSEIHEAVCLMLSLSKRGIPYEIFAPNKDQFHVVNHLEGKPTEEKRNVLVEAARIARGDIKALDKLDEKDFGALLLPGGFGAAKNLSSYAFDGDNMQVDEAVKAVVCAFHKNKKPIVALCISPMILAHCIEGAMLTIGEDSATCTHVEAMGGKHVKTSHGEACVDEKNKLITTPCYMLDARLSDIFEGTEAAVEALLKQL